MYKITIFTIFKPFKNNKKLQNRNNPLYDCGTFTTKINGTFNTECVARPALRVLGSNVSSSGHLTALCKQCVRAPALTLAHRPLGRALTHGTPRRARTLGWVTMSHPGVRTTPSPWRRRQKNLMIDKPDQEYRGLTYYGQIP